LISAPGKNNGQIAVESEGSERNWLGKEQHASIHFVSIEKLPSNAVKLPS
jgi:hypothetical protein